MMRMMVSRSDCDDTRQRGVKTNNRTIDVSIGSQLCRINKALLNLNHLSSYESSAVSYIFQTQRALFTIFEEEICPEGL